VHEGLVCFKAFYYLSVAQAHADNHGCLHVLASKHGYYRLMACQHEMSFCVISS
jgi:hypothetical protein